MAPAAQPSSSRPARSPLLGLSYAAVGRRFGQASPGLLFFVPTSRFLAPWSENHSVQGLPLHGESMEPDLPAAIELLSLCHCQLQALMSVACCVDLAACGPAWQAKKKIGGRK